MSESRALEGIPAAGQQDGMTASQLQVSFRWVALSPGLQPYDAQKLALLICSSAITLVMVPRAVELAP